MTALEKPVPSPEIRRIVKRLVYPCACGERQPGHSYTLNGVLRCKTCNRRLKKWRANV